MRIRAALLALHFGAQVGLCAWLGLGSEFAPSAAVAAPPCHVRPQGGPEGGPPPSTRDDGCAAHCAALLHALGATPPTAAPPSSPALAPAPQPLRIAAEAADTGSSAEERAPPPGRARLARLAVQRC